MRCPVLLWSAAVFLYCLTCLIHYCFIFNTTGPAPTDRASIKSTEEKEDFSHKNEHPLVCDKIWENPEHSNKEWQSLESGLETYRRFHRQQLQKLKGRNTSSLLQGVRTLTWSCYDQCSGLGDQLHQITFALILSIVSNRVFIIHWEQQYKAVQQLHPNQIDWTPSYDIEDVQKNIASKRAIIPPSAVAERILSSNPHVHLSTEIGVPFYRTFVRFKTVKTLECGLRELGLLDILRTESDRYKLTFLLGLLLRYLFNISHDIFSKLEQTQARIGLRDREYVAVHIRTGFFGSLLEETGRFSRHKVSRSKRSWEEIMNCSLTLAEKEYGKDSPILLATDSLVAKEWAMEVYGSKVITIDHTLYHSGHTHPLREENYDGVWIDFLLLSKAGYLVRGSSGFSVIAGGLCSLPQFRQCTLTCACKQYHVH